MKKFRTGLTLGKFLPFHLGHQYLIDFARNYVDDLTVVIGVRSTDPIPGPVRIAWLKEMYPGVNIIPVNDTLPADENHPRYWQIWENTLRKAIPKIPEYFFASETYGPKLAGILGMKYVPVDHQRNLVPISATAIRKDPMKNWQFIPPVVRPFFVKRVCIYGPESTGKSTLTKDLAKYYKTVFCEEYARSLIDTQNQEVNYPDIDRIARGHWASEQAMARQANRVLFSDTDMLTTIFWSNILFKDCPGWIYKEVEKIKYDLYLVTDIDIPWVKDPQRFLPKKRRWFMDMCLRELDKRNRKYIIIRGDRDKRLAKAVKAVDNLIYGTIKNR